MPAEKESGGYKALTISRLAYFLRKAATDERTRWKLISEFLEEYRWEPLDSRGELLVEEPESTGDERWDVLLAALAEHVAIHDGRPGPEWANDRTLVQFWFPYNTPFARVDAFVHAPASFRRRGVFLARRELEVA